jgi:hypothetical protein
LAAQVVVPGHKWKVERHSTPHTLFWQVALPPLAGPVQALSQEPQCAGEVFRSTHIVPHCVGADAGHEFVHPVAAQIGLSAPHMFPQVPQFTVVSVLVSHPSSGLALQ